MNALTRSHEDLADQLRACTELTRLLDCTLERALDIMQTDVGNLQLVNWDDRLLDLKAVRGCENSFITRFASVPLHGGLACSRAVRTRGIVIVGDITADANFSSSLDVLLADGIRAVQSTPLISSGGALVGVVSTHFSKVCTLTADEIDSVKMIAKTAADSIVKYRAKAKSVQESVRRSLEPLMQSKQFLSRGD